MEKREVEESERVPEGYKSSLKYLERMPTMLEEEEEENMEGIFGSQ